MTLRAVLFAFLSLCSQGVLTSKPRSGIRHEPHFQRELGARPNVTSPIPLTLVPSPTILVTSFPTFEPTTSFEHDGDQSLWPTKSYQPSSPPSTVGGPSVSSPQAEIPNPSQQPAIQKPSAQPGFPNPSSQTTSPSTSPKNTTSTPSPQMSVPTPTLPPVSIQIPTSDEAMVSGVPVDGSNGVVGAGAVKSRDGPQKMISAAAITGLTLGLSGLCIMGFVASRRRGDIQTDAELKDSTPEESSD